MPPATTIAGDWSADGILGNLSSHLSKLEAADYVAIEKEFLGKKPHTMLRITDEGRVAFQEYRQNMKQVLDELPAQ